MKIVLNRFLSAVLAVLLVVNTSLAYGQEMPATDVPGDIPSEEPTAEALEEISEEQDAPEQQVSELVDDNSEGIDDPISVVEESTEETSEPDGAEQEELEEKKLEDEPAIEESQTDEAQQADEIESVDDAEEESSRKEKTALSAQAAQGQQPSVRYRAHVQRNGWMGWFADGKVAGTSGESLRMEAFRVELRNAKGKLVKGISYQTHVQSIGWQDWVSDGALAGTEGRGLRAEAIRIRLSDALAESYDVWYSVHIQRHGWLGWAKNGAAAGSSGNSLRVEAIKICVMPKGSSAPSGSNQEPFVDGARIMLDGHVQSIGWVSGTTSVGTVGQGLRMEAIKARLYGAQYEGGVRYSAHVQGIGWQSEVANGRMAGTSGQSKRVEAITMRLTGDARSHYDVWYRLHVQSFGWLGWAKNGERAGTEGLGRRAESIEVRLLPKGSAQPSSSDSSQEAPYIGAVSLTATAKLVGGRWQTEKSDGQTLGSTEQGKAIEFLRASVSVPDGALEGGISYRVRPVGGDWQSTMKNGADAGVSGKGVNAVRVSLTGGLKSAFDIWYRTYVTKHGWLAWVRGGAQAGTEVKGEKVEALQITVLPKGHKPSGESPWSVGYMTKVVAESQGQSLADANARQRRLVESAYTTPAAPAGYCAQWVEDVYANAGFGRFYGDACDLYDRYCYSADLSQLKAGMIVCVSTHPHTSAGSIWGHVGIFVGDGIVKDSVYGYVRTSTLKDWMDYYGATVPVMWGWIGNVNVA